MLELYGKLSDIRDTTKDQLFLAIYVCSPYTVSLGIFRQKFFLLDAHKVSSRSGGVGEGVVITTKHTSNQLIEEICAWLWKRLDKCIIRTNTYRVNLVGLRGVCIYSKRSDKSILCYDIHLYLRKKAFEVKFLLSELLILLVILDLEFFSLLYCNMMYLISKKHLFI